MNANYEYEQLILNKNPISVKKFISHNSNGRIHWHEALEILYFTQGNAITACNFEEYSVEKGSIVLVNGNECHTGIISEKDSIFYCIQFEPNFIHNLIGDKYYTFNNIINDSDCTKLLNKLISLSKEKNNAKNLLERKKIAYEFFILLLERHVKSVSEEENYKKQFKKLDTFHKIIDYINANYTEELSITDLSIKFNMSPSYFAHFFKEYAQKSVIKYLNEIRILKAKNILEKEDLSISEIALKVGFLDINYFSRKFKAITGKTPMQYKKR